MNLQVITCKKCKNDYLVGIDGKDITKKGSFGKHEEIDFFSIGNDEIDESKKIKKTINCPECKTRCNIVTI